MALFQHEARYISTGPSDGDPTLSRLRGAVAERPPELLEVGGGAGYPMTPAGHLKRLKTAGVEPEVVAGQLILWSRGIIPIQLRELINLTRPLLVAEITGQPIKCALGDGHDAVDVADIDLLVCGAHYGYALEPVAFGSSGDPPPGSGVRARSRLPRPLAVAED
jgi:hypothetical protein